MKTTHLIFCLTAIIPCIAHAAPLSNTPHWTRSGGQTGARLGAGLSSGDFNGDGFSDLLTAEWRSDEIGGSGSWQALLYNGSAEGLTDANGWTTQPATAIGDLNGDGFSDALTAGPSESGSYPCFPKKLYFHYGSDTGLSSTSQGMIQLPCSGPVAAAGDVNGDGFDDIAVGGDAVVYLYYGSPSGISSEPSWEGRFPRGQITRYLVAAAGDVNGDGYSDLLTSDVRNPSTGSAYVFHGSPDGPAEVPDWQAVGPAPYSSFGLSISTAGDFNGDGYSDIIIGAPDYKPLSLETGKVFIYMGGPTGLSAAANWSYAPSQHETRFGEAVAGVGDINGDGRSDILVGAPYLSNGNTKEGAVFLISAASNSSIYIPWIYESHQDNVNLGSLRSPAGDFNGDDINDLVISAPNLDGTSVDEGKIYMFYGNVRSNVGDWSVY